MQRDRAANLSTRAARRNLDSLRRELLPRPQDAVAQIESDLLGAARVESSSA
jgi:hypothetical protein